MKKLQEFVCTLSDNLMVYLVSVHCDGCIRCWNWVGVLSLRGLVTQGLGTTLGALGAGGVEITTILSVLGSSLRDSASELNLSSSDSSLSWGCCDDDDRS